MSLRNSLCFLLPALLAFQCGQKPEPQTPVEPEEAEPASIQVKFLRSYPHDISSFTEGFLFEKGKLYESTGASPGLDETRSLFGSVDLSTGRIQKNVEIDGARFFGEGITFLNGKVYQLTWQNKIGFEYDAKTFKKLREFPLPGEEGWGMTTDGKSLIMSDGSSQIYFLDPTSLKKTKSINVTDRGYSIDKLNELEYIDGSIYANVWMTNTIVKFDAQSGKVTGKLDLSAFAAEAMSLNPKALEMNGIAWEPDKKELYITGKMWPRIYVLKLLQ